MDLPQINAAGVVEFDGADLVSGELDASDISAARQVARYLGAFEQVSHEISTADFSAARQAAQYLAAGAQVTGELSVDDISAAREAAQTLTTMFVAGGVDLKNPAFPRTAKELELAQKFGASEEQFAMLFSAE
jgi:hypothetical protein